MEEIKRFSNFYESNLRDTMNEFYELASEI